MEELLATMDPAHQRFFTFFSVFLLTAGIAAAFILARFHHRNPPDRAALDRRMTDRACGTSCIALTIGTYFLLQLLSPLLIPLLPTDSESLQQLATTLLIYGGTLGTALQLNHRSGKTCGSAYGMGRQQLASLKLAPVFYLASIPVLMSATAGFHFVLKQIPGLEPDLQDTARLIMQDTSWIRSLYIFTAVVAAPLYEEILFRGILFPHLAKRTGTPRAILLTSLGFAVLHFHLPSLLPLALLSAALCLAYWRTGSLWVCIGMHALFNAISILPLLLAG